MGLPRNPDAFETHAAVTRIGAIINPCGELLDTTINLAYVSLSG